MNNYELSLAALTSLQDNKKFQRFLRDTKAKGAAGGMDLMALLIQPVQRIPRYELLLKELQRHTGAGAPAQLGAALAKIQDIGQHVNETKRLVDRVADLLGVQIKLASSLPHDQDSAFGIGGSLYAPHRRLVREGALEKRGRSLLASDKSRRYYLFNDLLLWTNSHDRYKNHVMLLYAQVADAAPDKEQAELAFELTRYALVANTVADPAPASAAPAMHMHMQQLETILLYCANAAERKAWVKDIGIAIQEAVSFQPKKNIRMPPICIPSCSSSFETILIPASRRVVCVWSALCALALCFADHVPCCPDLRERHRRSGPIASAQRPS